ncbi:MAG: flagellar filament capping protein FliD, partial [Spongiibacteraceae bacterium]
MASITAQGVGSGLDIGSIVTQLVAAERAPQENRLNSKEALIQARLSAYGSLKSAFTSFQDSLTALQDVDSFNKRSVTVDSGASFTATADSTAVSGSYAVEVQQLATNHKIASGAYTDEDTSVGTGTLDITVNGESFSIDVESGADSLANIRDAINTANDNVGVSASIVNDQDGAHLVLTSDESGLANEIEVAVTVDGGDTGDLTQLAFDPNAGSNPVDEKVAAKDSIIVVGGFTQTSSTDVVEDVITGVSFTLTEENPGETFNFSVSVDTASVKKDVESFVSSYNKLSAVLRDLTSYDPETNTAGLLQGDGTTRGIASGLRNVFNTAVSGLSSELDTLTELGITKTITGDLEIDSETLTGVLDDNFSAIADVFSGENGYATRLDSFLSNVTSSGGLLDNRTEGLESQVDRISDQRLALDRRIATIEARYQAQFSALDTLLGQLNSTGDFLTQQ